MTMSEATDTFPSKIDAWLVALLLASALLVLVAVITAWPRQAAPAHAVLLAALLALGTGLPLWVLAATGYRVEQDALAIRSGPLRWRIPLRDIRSVEPSRSWLSSPALSLDRLCIRHGRAGQVLVSPKDRQAFVQALRCGNAHIQVTGF
ncbi:MAG: PH domain-containing protein [Acidovorax sp.]|uniref:PH domain-containing protein n=1 Tax=Acidovorax sp. TaxID=1872122 RepID=UPI0039E6DA7D